MEQQLRGQAQPEPEPAVEAEIVDDDEPEVETQFAEDFTADESAHAYAGTTMDLVVINNEGVPVTTSLKVAEYFEKRHKNVLRTIQSILNSPTFQEKGNGLTFEPVDYLDTKGESRPMYRMNKDGFVLLVMRLKGEVAMAAQLAYIEAFNMMETKLREGQKTIADLTTEEILELALKDREQKKLRINKLEHENAQLAGERDHMQEQLRKAQPIMKDHKDLQDSNGLYAPSAVAKMLGLGPIIFNRTLRKYGYLRYDNQPYQQHINQGLFKLQPGNNGNGVWNTQKVYITPKGLESFKHWIESGIFKVQRTARN